MTFHTRLVGDVAVVTCAGSIAWGETAAFEAHLDDLIRITPQVLPGCERIDLPDGFAATDAGEAAKALLGTLRRRLLPGQ